MPSLELKPRLHDQGGKWLAAGIANLIAYSKKLQLLRKQRQTQILSVMQRLNAASSVMLRMYLCLILLYMLGLIKAVMSILS